MVQAVSSWLMANILWMKALHIMSIIAWMAGMFYLPRLFVYHTMVPVGSESSELFKVMERKLLRMIMTPAMIASWIFGLALVGANIQFYMMSGWFHWKLLAVILLTGMHGLLARWVRVFAEDRNTHSERFYRIINEVPTVLMIIIVVLVVVSSLGGMAP